MKLLLDTFWNDWTGKQFETGMQAMRLANEHKIDATLRHYGLKDIYYPGPGYNVMGAMTLDEVMIMDELLNGWDQKFSFEWYTRDIGSALWMVHAGKAGTGGTGVVFEEWNGSRCPKDCFDVWRMYSVGSTLEEVRKWVPFLEKNGVENEPWHCHEDYWASQER